MDELNKAFKRLKTHYKAVNPIKIDPDELVYKLELETKVLSPMVKNLVDKVIDICDEVQDMKGIGIEELEAFIQAEKGRYAFVGQLAKLYENLDNATKTLVVEYLADELSIEVMDRDQEEEAGQLA